MNGWGVVAIINFEFNQRSCLGAVRYIGKIMARCTTRGLREHSLRINSGLGGDMLTRLDKKKDDRQTNGQIAKN